MKIAVCFSGESRTWLHAVNSIKAFYTGNHDFYFFGHVWANNTWGNHPAYPVPEILDLNELSISLRSKINFTKLIVEHHHPEIDFKGYEQHNFGEELFGKKKVFNTTIPTTWRSPLYSSMLSNHYKYQYEQDNDTHFDVVVHARLDVCYTPMTSINDYLPGIIQPHALYCNTNYFKKEYMLPAFNDVFYFGSSDVMDIIDSFYRIYHNGNFYKMLGCDYFDGAYKATGPGALLYKWMTIKNILPIYVKFSQMPVIRKTAEGLRWPQDFSQIMEKYTTW